jgi:ABC-type spermidine/putrescine transport system permease subunit I
MKGIDPTLLRASSGLGASRWTTFWWVYFPLSMPGVGAGAVLVFVLGLGFFVTPALLGGARDLVVSTSIDQLLSQRLAFDEAAAVALTLLGLTLLILAIIGRFVPIGSVWGRR